MTVSTSVPDIISEELVSALRPPERVRASEWASRNVVLPPDAPIRGHLDHRHAPYLPGVIDLCNAAGVQQVNVQKAGQIGVSAASRWLMGYWAQLEPAPMGLTLPDKVKGRKIVSGDVMPFFRETRVLRSLMTGRNKDETDERMRLANGFTLHLMWAGSASSTASFPLRRVINDETDKMQAWGRGGGEGHAVHRTKTRMRVFGETSVQVNISTPTTTAGVIHKLFVSSEWQLAFLVECPHCGARIRLVWDRVKFKHYSDKPEKKEWAARILRELGAWYVCQACEGDIDESARLHAIQDGKWGTFDENGIGDGHIADATDIPEWRQGTTIGMQVSALYCTWESLPKLAAGFVRALGNLELMFTFITETLGEPFEQQIETLPRSEFSEMSQKARLPEGKLPWWTASLIASIDTQKDYFWVVIRAWGPAMRSQRVWHGRAETFADLERLCFSTTWPYERDVYPAVACDMAVIDSGGTKVAGVSRTMEVYEWTLANLHAVRAIKGESKPKPGMFFRRGKGYYDSGGQGVMRVEVPIWLLDTHHYHDELAALMRRTISTPTPDDEHATEKAWSLNSRDDDEYNTHMANMRKVADREGTELVEKWRPVTTNARVDYRACECYQIAAAYMRQINLLPQLAEFKKQRDMQVQRRRETQQNPGALGMTMPGDRPFIAER